MLAPSGAAVDDALASPEWAIVTSATASPAPQANLRRYAERMGWTDVPWYTISTERFSADFGVAEWFSTTTDDTASQGLSRPSRQTVDKSERMQTDRTDTVFTDTFGPGLSPS